MQQVAVIPLTWGIEQVCWNSLPALTAFTTQSPHFKSEKPFRVIWDQKEILTWGPPGIDGAPAGPDGTWKGLGGVGYSPGAGYDPVGGGNGPGGDGPHVPGGTVPHGTVGAAPGVWVGAEYGPGGGYGMLGAGYCPPIVGPHAPEGMDPHGPTGAGGAAGSVGPP